MAAISQRRSTLSVATRSAVTPRTARARAAEAPSSPVESENPLKSALARVDHSASLLGAPTGRVIGSPSARKMSDNIPGGVTGTGADDTTTEGGKGAWSSGGRNT